jgi:hypothetical protein
MPKVFLFTRIWPGAVQYLLVPITAGIIGYCSFTSTPAVLALLCLIPVVYAMAESRLSATLAMFCYHLMASRGLAAGSAAYFNSDLSLGVAIWLAGNALNAGVFGALWSRNPKIRPLSFIASVLLLSLPPLGILGWASPLTAAGVLFPGLQWVGLLLAIFLLYFLAEYYRHPRKIVFLLVLSAVSSHLYVPAREPKWHAINTNFGSAAPDPSAEYLRYLAVADGLKNARSVNVVLPESTSPAWNEASIELWRGIAPANGVLALGSEIDSADGKTQVTGFLSTHTTRRYLQRQPIPLSMWRPWSADGYDIHWFANPTIEVNGQTLAPLVCFETFLVWPILASRFHGAEEIVATANLWWASRTSIPGIQNSIVMAWSLLFDMPYALAVNI